MPLARKTTQPISQILQAPKVPEDGEERANEREREREREACRRPRVSFHNSFSNLAPDPRRRPATSEVIISVVIYSVE